MQKEANVKHINFETIVSNLHTLNNRCTLEKHLISFKFEVLSKRL